MGLFDNQNIDNLSSGSVKRRAVDGNATGETHSDILPTAIAAINDLDNRLRTLEGHLMVTFEFANGNNIAEFVLKGTDEYNTLKVKGTQHSTLMEESRTPSLSSCLRCMPHMEDPKKGSHFL